MEQLNTQLACHFQIIYYKLTHGSHKTPLQIMMTNSIYRKTRSKGIITDLTTAEVTITYREMKIKRRLLSQYKFSCNRSNKRPKPSRSSKDLTKDTLNNDNFADQNLISGTNVKNYTTQALHYYAAEKPNSKPSISRTNLKKNTALSDLQHVSNQQPLGS